MVDRYRTSFTLAEIEDAITRIDFFSKVDAWTRNGYSTTESAKQLRASIAVDLLRHLTQISEQKGTRT
jgi:hypothetical protein